MDKIKFRKPIDSRDFEGRVIHKGITVKGDLFFVKTEYDFGYRKAIGEVNAAFDFRKGV